MKEFIIENMEIIISFVSMVITWLLGKVVKHHTNLSNKLIPLQNVLIMVICVAIYYFATGDISTVIAVGSPVATLIYDILHNIREYNLEKLNNFEELEEEPIQNDDELLEERDEE